MGEFGLKNDFCLRVRTYASENANDSKNLFFRIRGPSQDIHHHHQVGGVAGHVPRDENVDVRQSVLLPGCCLGDKRWQGNDFSFFG